MPIVACMAKRSNNMVEADSNPDPRAVSVAILKGGVGKSTIAVNLTERLSNRGHDALFIDLDPNGHASIGLGFKDAYQNSDVDIGDVILDDGDATPRDAIHSTGFGFDVLPATTDLEQVEDGIRNSAFPATCLRTRLIRPLLEESVYDYIVTDSPAYRGKLSDNALIASQNLLVPLVPGQEALAGFERTMERQIKPIREQIGLNILGVAPNRLGQRIDQRTATRQLVEDLNKNFPEYVPQFARITDEEFDRIDNDEYDSLPKPGIRDRDAFTHAFGERQPLAHYDPVNDQLPYFDELAAIIEQGGIIRD